MTDKTDPTVVPEDEVVPFDDCLRLLVNTPPRPKKAEDKPPPGKEQKESGN